jgi:hypothetical protein
MGDATLSTPGTVKFGKCREQACTVATDGECYEGLSDLSACPNYLPISDEDLAVDEDFDDADTEDSDGRTAAGSFPLSVDLYRGGELDYKSSLRITLAALTRVVVLAGPNDSGKTTLLASIYEHFFREPLAGFLFAGSESLPPFDERCHLSRTDSERQTEDTERTKSYSEQTMLHLCVRDETLRERARHLLLSDIRGELFKGAITSKAEAQRIKILKRADHLSVLVDGRQLADLNNRNQAATAAKMTLRSFIEAEMIGRRTFVDVLFTKDDLIQITDKENKTTDFLKATEDEIRRKHEHQVRRLRFHRIAVRAAEGVRSYGLPELFRSWVEDSAYLLQADEARPESPRIITSPRESDRFAVNHLPERFIEKGR